MKILAIDFGVKRLGLARGEMEMGIAFPHSTLENNTTAHREILLFCRRENIARVLVGLPLLPSGRRSTETENAHRFAEDLEDFFWKHDFEIAVDFFDERYSTKTAKTSAAKMGHNEKSMRGHLDSAAAAVFLQHFFDSQ